MYVIKKINTSFPNAKNCNKNIIINNNNDDNKNRNKYFAYVIPEVSGAK